MCGIVGIVGKSVQPEEIEKALRAIKHRGPDAQGIYQEGEVNIGHLRLSIIDLSSAAGQPMKDDATGVVIAFNGEIYNYRELKEALQGEPFRTQSDTEVILRLYLRYGMGCANRLRGMFAFVIWDPRSQTLHLCRDRFGIKPLYYHYDGDVLIFSSEIKGLMALGLRVELNLHMVYDYLKYGLTAHTQETFFNPVRSLEPGTTLSLCEGQIQKTTYWSPVSISQEHGSPREVEEQTWELLQETLRLHMVSDVPVGISLSSGLDSQLIVHLLSRLGQGEFHTFTVGYDEPEYDEIIRVQGVKFPLSLTQHYLRLTPEEMMESLQRAITYFEVPLGGLGTLSAYRLMQVTHDVGIKVLLSGEGADEVFGGYKYYYYAYFRDLYEKGQTALLQRELQAFARTNGEQLEIGSMGFQQHVLNETNAVRAPDGTSLGGNGFLGPILLELAEENGHGEGRTKKKQHHDHLRRAMLRDLVSLKIPKLLWFQDRTSMAWGIETRVPYLDHKLVEFAYRLPANSIICDGVSKYLPKRLLQRYGSANKLSMVKHYVATPQREWLKGPLYEIVNRYLEEGRLGQSGLIDYAGWKRAYADYAESPVLGNSFFVWKMINLEALLREFFR